MPLLSASPNGIDTHVLPLIKNFDGSYNPVPSSELMSDNRYALSPSTETKNPLDQFRGRRSCTARGRNATVKATIYAVEESKSPRIRKNAMPTQKG